VYVHCRDGFSYAAWIENLRAGRTFVTNGPMLRLEAEGLSPGGLIELSEPAAIRVTALASAQYPLVRLEVVHNGQVVAQAAAGGDRLQIAFDQDISVAESGWLAVRARGERGPLETAGEAFAHTSPIYLRVASREPYAPEDAAYFVTWIERLWQDVRRRNRIPPRHQAHVADQIAEALALYRRKMQEPPPQEP
jgi:hypothetical protein